MNVTTLVTVTTVRVSVTLATLDHLVPSLSVSINVIDKGSAIKVFVSVIKALRDPIVRLPRVRMTAADTGRVR
jgi:hypothetical protein